MAKTLSMDMRANYRQWLGKLKLDVLATVAEERAFEMPFPPHGEKRLFPGVVAATAAVIRWALRAARRAAGRRAHAWCWMPCSAARSLRTTASGTLAWAVDVNNPATGEAFTVTLKEVESPSGEGSLITRPCASGFSGNYPRALDGLARLLSLEMRLPSTRPGSA